MLQLGVKFPLEKVSKINQFYELGLIFSVILKSIIDLWDISYNRFLSADP